jgi:hypothetical protein
VEREESSVRGETESAGEPGAAPAKAQHGCAEREKDADEADTRDPDEYTDSIASTMAKNATEEPHDPASHRENEERQREIY